MSQETAVCKWCGKPIKTITVHESPYWMHVGGWVWCGDNRKNLAEPSPAVPQERSEWAGSGNYIADREQAPQWVAFANGRTVSIARPSEGDPYLVIGEEQQGERWLRRMAAAEDEAGNISVGGLALDVGLYETPAAPEAPIPEELIASLYEWMQKQNTPPKYIGLCDYTAIRPLIEEYKRRAEAALPLVCGCIGSCVGHNEAAPAAQTVPIPEDLQRYDATLECSVTGAFVRYADVKERIALAEATIAELVEAATNFLPYGCPQKEEWLTAQGYEEARAKYKELDATISRATGKES